MMRLKILALAMACMGAIGSANLRAETPKATTPVVAVFDLHGTLSDQPPVEDPLFGAIGADSLQSLLTRLKKAGQDENLSAVVFLLNDFNLSSAQVEELRQGIAKLREKKPVYLHVDSVSTRTYLLACAAGRLSMSPTGDCWVNGLALQELYVRGLLDMLGVQPEFLTCGKYKSAAEMFMRKESSKEALEMHNWLLDSMFESTLNMIAESRKVTSDKAKEWIDQGMYSAESAKSAGLIDEVESREGLLKFIKTTHGSTVKLDKAYGKKTAADIDLENPFAMMQLWGKLLSGSKTAKSTKNAIAIVHIDGSIMLGKPEPSLFGGSESAHSETIRKALDKVADEPRIRAVVLRVNSPGGSATASEIMLQAVMNVQTSKPVIVSMGGVAASGGYYVSTRADRIFADATTITGSIGVVAGKLATNEMWGRIGVNFDQLQRGKRAGMMTSNKLWTPGEKEELQSWMDDVYGVFKTHVEEGRKGKLTKAVDDLAGGRVYSGKQALELGLVDEIGTLEDAISFAAKKVELQDYEIRSFPEHLNFIEQLLADIGEQKKEDDKRLSTGIWSSVAPALQSIDPQGTAMLREALLQLDHLQNERVMLTSPVLRLLDR